MHLSAEPVAEVHEVPLQRRSLKEVVDCADEGCQFTSIDFGRGPRDVDGWPSMGTMGDDFDNVRCESFTSLECELLDRWPIRTQEGAPMAVHTSTEGSHNPRLRKSAFGHISPIRFEPRHADSIAVNELEGPLFSRGTEGLIGPPRASASET